MSDSHLTEEEALRLLANGPAGVRKWNELRSAPGATDDNLLFEEPEFEEADLSHCDLTNADLTHARFAKANFSDARLDGADLCEADLTEANLGRAKLRGTRLDEASLHRAHLAGADCVGCSLKESDLSHANIHMANLTKAQLPYAKLVHANLHGTILLDAVLEGADLSDAQLGHETLLLLRHPPLDPHQDRSKCGAFLRSADLRKANLRRANLSFVNLDDADLNGADLRETILIGASLKGASLISATLNAKTQLHSASVAGCKIDRLSLECLGSEYGGLTIADRRSMKVTDDLARLRLSYSGFWQWIHVAALLLFAFPYAWFVLANWGKARFGFGDRDHDIVLGEAILRYIVNGGMNWQQGWEPNYISCSIFLLVLAYNLTRLLLLWKTKQLELEQEVTGLSSPFALEGTRWGAFYSVAQVMFWVNLILVGYHTVHFLSQRIPLP